MSYIPYHTLLYVDFAVVYNHPFRTRNS